MKKILVSALIAIMVGATLTGCGKANNGNNQSVEQGTGQTSSVSAKEVVEKLSEEELFMMPTMVDDEMAKDIYHLNLEDIVELWNISSRCDSTTRCYNSSKSKRGKS